MVNSTGYTQRHYQKKQDIKAETLGSHWKLKDQNASSKLNINRDDGNFVKANAWTPLLRNINDLESAFRNQRSHCNADIASN